jgi:hypothetical protein
LPSPVSLVPQHIASLSPWSTTASSPAISMADLFLVPARLNSRWQRVKIASSPLQVLLWQPCAMQQVNLLNSISVKAMSDSASL